MPIPDGQISIAIGRQQHFGICSRRLQSFRRPCLRKAVRGGSTLNFSSLYLRLRVRLLRERPAIEKTATFDISSEAKKDDAQPSRLQDDQYARLLARFTQSSAPQLGRKLRALHPAPMPASRTLVAPSDAG
jgi:hypothetical protein